MLLDASVDPKCCQLGQDNHPGTCLARTRNFSVSSISSSFHPRDACVIEFYKCCYRKFELGKDNNACCKVSHNRTAFYETVFVYFLDWRRRSGEVDIPGDLLNDLPFEDEEILKLTLDEAQVRTNFPETWLYEHVKAG